MVCSTERSTPGSEKGKERASSSTLKTAVNPESEVVLNPVPAERVFGESLPILPPLRQALLDHSSAISGSRLIRTAPPMPALLEAG